MKALMNNGHSWLEQAAMADFMFEGGYRRHLRRVRQTYLERRDALLRSLEKNFGTFKVSGENAGMHLIWTIPDSLPDAKEVERRALDCGVGVYRLSSGGALYLGPDDPSCRHLVLGYAALTPKQIDYGISQLAHMLKSEKPKSLFSAHVNGKGALQ